MKKTLFSCFLLSTIIISAQSTWIEGFAGHNRSTITLGFNTPLDSAANYLLTGTAFFYQHYTGTEKEFNESGAMSSLYRRVFKKLYAGGTLYQNSIGGFQKKFSLFFISSNKRCGVLFLPSLVHIHNNIYGELMGQLWLTKPLSPTRSFIALLRVMTQREHFATHARSFQQLRIGLDYRALRWGAALDADQYGPSAQMKITAGFFLYHSF